VISDRVAAGLAPCAAGTSSYVRARARLPLPLLQRLMREVAVGTETCSPSEWRWKGHSVKLLDGSTLLAADTEANRKAFPIHGGQRKEVGFPILRICALISLGTGCVHDAAIAPFQGKLTGELTLARQILPRSVKPGDLLLGDALMDSYFFLCQIKSLGADGLFEVKTHRHVDFRRGMRLGLGDQQVELPKPARPAWMSREEYERHPERITVRFLDDEGRVLVTTLLDSEEYPRGVLRALYPERWNVELDLRCIKDVMGMEMLRCKTPEMIEKEVWARLLAYNLIRLTMAQAAEHHGKDPRELSFTGAIQAMEAFAPKIQMAAGNLRLALRDEMLRVIASHRVGHRPGRREPRAVKRRPKPFPRLHVSRKSWKERRCA
jgi:hypothetical protein